MLKSIHFWVNFGLFPFKVNVFKCALFPFDATLRHKKTLFLTDSDGFPSKLNGFCIATKINGNDLTGQIYDNQWSSKSSNTKMLLSFLLFRSFLLFAFNFFPKKIILFHVQLTIDMVFFPVFNELICVKLSSAKKCWLNFPLKNQSEIIGHWIEFMCFSLKWLLQKGMKKKQISISVKMDPSSERNRNVEWFDIW